MAMNFCDRFNRSLKWFITKLLFTLVSKISYDIHEDENDTYFKIPKDGAPFQLIAPLQSCLQHTTDFIL